MNVHRNSNQVLNSYVLITIDGSAQSVDAHKYYGVVALSMIIVLKVIYLDEDVCT